MGTTYGKLGERQVIGLFWKGYGHREKTMWSKLIAEELKSDQAVETFRWLGPLPAMRQWQGQRQKKQLRVHELTIRHDKYENTIEVPVDDADRDKTGQIAARISELGSTAAVLPQKRLSQVIESPGNSYDGIAYWGNHTGAGGIGTIINNALTDSTVADPLRPTSAEMMRNVMDAVGTIQGALSPESEPIGDDAMQFVVMVPSLYQGPLAAALGDEFTSAGSSNSLRAFMAQEKIQIIPVTNPRLTKPSSTGVFYVFRMDTATKALIWQDEVSGEGGKPTKFDQLVEGSDETFWTDNRVYGVKRKGAAAPGEHAMACRVTLS